MHNLLEAACRRSAGIAAGVILTGGLAGGVLLTPAAAYATTTPVNTTTAITGVTQTPTFHGTTLNVQVSVTPADTTNGTPTGTVQVSGAGGGCTATLNSAGAGSCNIYNLPAGPYSLTANYGGVANLFNSSPPSSPYRVYIKQHVGADLRTFLNCTSKVFTGQRGTCTLYVTNRGFGPAPSVTAQIALPSQLRADFCGFFNFNFNFGCRIFNNTAQENLGTLNPGQTKELTVVFTARTGFNLWGWHHGHRFTVRVVGSAFSFGGFPFFQHSASFATAYVTVIPRGWWT